MPAFTDVGHRNLLLPAQAVRVLFSKMSAEAYGADGEYSALSFGTSCMFTERVPHKIQGTDAPVPGVMEEESVNVSSENPWQNVPNLNFDRDDRKVRLNYNWYDNANSNWAVPSSRDSSPQTRSARAGLLLGE